MMHRNITFMTLLLGAISMIVTTNSNSHSLSSSDSIESLSSADNDGLDTSLDLNLILELLEELDQESNDQDEAGETFDDNATEQTSTESPTTEPTNIPSVTPSNAPSKNPTSTPSDNPSATPSTTPTKAQSDTPTAAPISTPFINCSAAAEEDVCGTINTNCICAFNADSELICVQNNCTQISNGLVCNDASVCATNQECATAEQCGEDVTFCVDLCDNPNSGGSGAGPGPGTGTGGSIPIELAAHSVNINNKDTGTDYKQFNDQSDDDKNGPKNISYVIDISTNVWIILFMITLCGSTLLCSNVVMLRDKQKKDDGLSDECYK